MNADKKGIDPLLSLGRVFQSCGCGGRNTEWRDWVFPREGGAGEKPFAEAFSDLARAKGAEEPPEPHPGLYYRKGVERDPVSGGQAEGAFFSYFAFLGDFFAHPANSRELGMLLRQFMSRYCGPELLEGVPKGTRDELGKSEEALVKATGGEHAHITDTLRLLYNGSMARLVGTGTGKEIGAVHLGEGGRKLTPIGSPGALKAGLEREERDSRGKVFCVDGRTGRCYARSGWTDSEWTEAVARVEVESGGSEAAKRAGLRALDSHYFPEKVTGAVAMRYNIVAELRDEAIVHCRQRTPFSSLRIAARIGTEADATRGRSRGVGERHGDDIGGGTEFPEGFEGIDEGRYLPPPGGFEEMLPDDAGLEGLETAEARGTRGGAGEEGGGAGTPGAKAGKTEKNSAGRKPRTADDRAGREARKFIREGRVPVGHGGEDRLREIFGKGGFTARSYDPVGGCFVDGEIGGADGNARTWRRKAGEARDGREAAHIAGALLKGGRAGVAVAGDDGVFLVDKGPEGAVARFVPGKIFDNEASVVRGKVSLDGKTYSTVSTIRRVPFGEKAESGGGGAPRPLSRGATGGILGTLRRVFRGGR